MANRRMFSLDVVNTDRFLEMSSSAQCLYFHLGMRADDDGFVSSPKMIAKIANCSEDDLRLLATKGYIIPLDKGVIVITHWKQSNYIQKDRYKPTMYQEEKALLTLGDDNAYTLDTRCIHNVSEMETQVRLGKDSIDKDKTYMCAFESFWKAYPRKKEKAKAYKCYQARLKDGFSEQELLNAAIEYARECKERKTDERYIKLGATFLSASTPFADYIGKEGNADAAEESGRPAADFYQQYMS